MPCQCEGFNSYEKYLEIANAATRAACDMRTILRQHKLEKYLTPETLAWIKQHDAADAKRIAEEIRENKREAKKLAALNKLSLEERRVLGL